MDDSTEGSGKGRGIALKKYVMYLISRSPDHDKNIRMSIGSFDRIKNFTSAFLNQNLASFYMWLRWFCLHGLIFRPLTASFLLLEAIFVSPLHFLH